MEKYLRMRLGGRKIERTDRMTTCTEKRSNPDRPKQQGNHHTIERTDRMKASCTVRSNPDRPMQQGIHRTIGRTDRMTA